MSYNLTKIHCPTEKAITEATLIPWIIGLSGPIVSKLIMILAWLKDIAH